MRPQKTHKIFKQHRFRGFWEEQKMQPADIKNVKITDEFWSRKQALVKKEVIPYQWEILNDRIPEAEASTPLNRSSACSPGSH